MWPMIDSFLDLGHRMEGLQVPARARIPNKGKGICRNLIWARLLRSYKLFAGISRPFESFPWLSCQGAAEAFRALVDAVSMGVLNRSHTVPERPRQTTSRRVTAVRPLTTHRAPRRKRCALVGKGNETAVIARITRERMESAGIRGRKSAANNPAFCGCFRVVRGFRANV
jgi:hypothetical protein